MLETRQTEKINHFEVTASPRERVAVSLRLFWTNRRFIGRCVLAFSITSVMIVLLLPPRYQASTTILPAPASSATADISRMLRPDVSAMANLVGISSSSDQGRFMALLQSRVLSERVIARFDLQRIYHAKRIADARDVLSSRTDVQEDRKSGVITINVSDRDPERAAQIANGYAQELDRLNTQLNASGAHLQRVFLQSRVEEVGKELSQASQQLSQFSTKNSMLDVQEQAKSTVTAAMQLQGQIIAAESDLKGLEEIYQPDSVKVATAKARIGELKRQLAAIHGNQTEGSGDFPSIHNLPTLGVTYTELMRRAKLLEIVQTALTEQLEMAKTDEAKSIPSFRVLDPAEVPDYRVFPKRTQIVLVCTCAGLIIGMIIVLFRQHWNRVEDDDPIKRLISDAMHTLRGRRTLVFPDAEPAARRSIRDLEQR